MKLNKKTKIILSVLGGVIVLLLILLLCVKGCVKEYTVEFDTNGGSSIDSVKVKENEKVEKPKDPTKEGYEFDGWYLDDEEYDFDSKVTKDITLEAAWKEGNGNLVLNTSNFSIVIGNTETIEIIELPKGVKLEDLVWSSSDPTIATVENGVITAIKNGSTTITVSTKDGKYSKTIEVLVADEVIECNSVSITGLNTIEEGTSTILGVEFDPSNTTNQNVTWSSNNNDIATVDSNGKVTAKKAGKVNITVTTSNGKTATKEINIVEKGKEVLATKVSISGSSEVEVDKKIKLTATITPKNTTNKTLKWSSSNATIASVDRDGVVIGIKTGKVTITVTTSNGIKATKVITVKAKGSSEKDKTVELKDISVSPSSVTVQEGSTVSVIVSFTPSNTTERDLKWTSNDANTASITASGNSATIKGVKPGKTTVKVCSTKKTGICKTINVTVTAKPAEPEKPDSYTVEFTPVKQEGTGNTMQYSFVVKKNGQVFNEYERIICGTTPASKGSPYINLSSLPSTVTIKLSDGSIINNATAVDMSKR